MKKQIVTIVLGAVVMLGTATALFAKSSELSGDALTRTKICVRG